MSLPRHWGRLVEGELGTLAKGGCHGWRVQNSEHQVPEMLLFNNTANHSAYNKNSIKQFYKMYIAGWAGADGTDGLLEY